jgi:transcriptional regulator with XRE-family HTH domain
LKGKEPDELEEDLKKIFLEDFNYKLKDLLQGGKTKLAQKIGVWPGVISDILAGHYSTEDQRRTISKALGYDYEDFMGEREGYFSWVYLMKLRKI